MKTAVDHPDHGREGALGLLIAVWAYRCICWLERRLPRRGEPAG